MTGRVESLGGVGLSDMVCGLYWRSEYHFGSWRIELSFNQGTCTIENEVSW